MGATPIDFTEKDPVEQIKELRKRSPGSGALRPGEEKMDGVMCGIDAVGYQAHSEEHPDREDPMQTIRQLSQIVNPTGQDRKSVV